MTDATKYSVFAIKIATPYDRCLMVSGLTEADVKAYVYTAVIAARMVDFTRAALDAPPPSVPTS